MGLEPYLRLYDDDLPGALGLVVADLCTAGLTQAEAEAVVWQRAGELDVSGVAGGEVALAVAEQVQEQVMEDRVRIPWPPCPEHPGTHPLWLQGGAASWWTCPQRGRAVARLGELNR